MLEEWLYYLSSKEITVFLPRFNIEGGLKLSDYLLDMGVSDVFNENTADLSRLTDDMKSFIHNVSQKALVRVDEKGTEAAAATMVGMSGTSVKPLFRADHPFLFLIRDTKTGSILFLGRVLNPIA